MYIKMGISYILLTFYLICLSVTVQRDVSSQKCKEFLPMLFNDCSQTQKTYMLLFLTHVVVGLCLLVYVYGTDIFCWSYSQDHQANQKHTSESGTRDMMETPATEQADSGDMNEELNDSYFLILVDCIRVMISQAANEQEARNIIHQVLSEEFPKYFHNDIVINRLLDLNNKPSEVLLENKENETDGGGKREKDEEKHSLFLEDVYPEEDNEYTSVITDEQLISMISDILLISKANDCGTPFSPFEENHTSKTPVQRPVSLVDNVKENQGFEQDAKEPKMSTTYEDESVEMSSTLPMDQIYFLPDDADDSYLESADNESGLLHPLCEENLDGSLSWPSLPGESRIPSESELDHDDIDAYIAAAQTRYAFSKPSCVITTSSCRSCKDTEHDRQNIALTPTHVLPTPARLSLSGSLQGSFSDVLSKLTRVKRSEHKRKTGTVQELWSSNTQEDDTSIFNASFSISSLEDMLSPESIPPTPSSAVFGSPEKSPHVLGIRLHKPAGFKDVFLSVVDHDKTTGLPRNISDTWTLGTREEMELILHVDTDPHLRATRKYSGRYCLTFNDASDLDEYMSNQNLQEDFGFSMVYSHDDSNEEREFEIPSDEEYLVLSSFSHVDACCEEDRGIAREILPTDDHDEEEKEEGEEEGEIEEEIKEEKYQILLCNHGDNTFHTIGIKEEKRQKEKLPQDEKSDLDQERSAEQLHDSQRKWGKDSHRFLAFACLALTSYLAHRCLK